MTNTRKILIVDDDSELREALVEQLALHEEFESIAVDNGTKGVQAAKAGQIDLVIMDVGLPDVDGREAVRILRKNGFKSPRTRYARVRARDGACDRAFARTVNSSVERAYGVSNLLARRAHLMDRWRHSWPATGDCRRNPLREANIALA
jgi:DNA-binding response OmpR family regulator